MKIGEKKTIKMSPRQDTEEYPEKIKKLLRIEHTELWQQTTKTLEQIWRHRKQRWQQDKENTEVREKETKKELKKKYKPTQNKKNRKKYKKKIKKKLKKKKKKNSKKKTNRPKKKKKEKKKKKK